MVDDYQEEWGEYNEVIDEVESIAINRAKELFGAEYANVQPHSGSQANASVFHAFLRPGDKILGFDLAHGGHLTHGSSVNFSGRIYNASFYGVEKETGLLDYSEIRRIANKEKPQMIIAGASAYSRDIDFSEFRNIADEVNAFLLADISHPSGLIAKGLLNDPIPHCHVVTTTTHKTLRGARGGLILMGKDFENPFGLKYKSGKLKPMSNQIDMGVFPGNQGGPLEHVIAAKAVGFREALTDDFLNYIVRVRNNANAMANELSKRNYNLISGGTDNHMMLIDLRNKKITGKDAVIYKEGWGDQYKMVVVTTYESMGETEEVGDKVMADKRIVDWIQYGMTNVIVLSVCEIVRHYKS